MMCPTGREPDSGETGEDADQAVFASLLEDSAEELYENAPCGYLSTLMDGTIAKINGTLLDWLGLPRDDVVGRRRFSDLLTVGGRLYHETHFAPLLRMQGHINGIALELKARDGERMAVLVSSALKYGTGGEPLLVRTSVFDARDRRAYEEEQLRRRREAEELRARAEADRARLQEALAVLQQSLLPAALPDLPGLVSAAYYHTASPDQLGGDFYDLFRITDGRSAFFLGDVCGKGPQAATITSLTRYTLRAAAVHDQDPAGLLGTLNTVLLDRYNGDDPRFCTAIVGNVEHEPGTGGARVRLASGGHPPAFVLRADGTCETVDTPGGLLVGVLPGARFVPAAVELGPGDTLLLYTDGLTEARVGPGRALYGEEGLREFLTGCVGAAPAAVVDALALLLAGFGDGVTDDVALLAIGVPPEGL